MTDLSTVDFLTRLATGVGCGALIGVERQWRARMAGLRTNALVATGATLFVLYSVVAGDPSTTRVASYVVSGIGFLGGGVILRKGGGVRGLNTAATLWCSAAVGVLAASGHLLFAWTGALTVLLVHMLLRPAGRLIDQAPTSTEEDMETPVVFNVECDRKRVGNVRALLVTSLNISAVTLAGLRTKQSDDSTVLEARLDIEGSPTAVLDPLIARLSLEPGVHDLHWHRVEDEED
ncbi:MgtC/SapB family protein [Actinocorallia lasiicapitis]